MVFVFVSNFSEQARFDVFSELFPEVPLVRNMLGQCLGQHRDSPQEPTSATPECFWEGEEGRSLVSPMPCSLLWPKN